jgi:molybdopterin-binding protein
MNTKGFAVFSFDSLGLNEGQSATAIFKAGSVILAIN